MVGDMDEEQVLKKYNTYLNHVYKLVGDKTTYDSQLADAGRYLFGIKFKGVFPSDKIPRLNDLKSYAILNLDKSTEGGSHWIAIAKVPCKSRDTSGENTLMIYDSFGWSHRKIIPSLNLSGNGRIKNTDLDSEQDVLETNCGARCLAWLAVFDNFGADAAILV